MGGGCVAESGCLNSRDTYSAICPSYENYLRGCHDKGECNWSDILQKDGICGGVP